MSVAKQLYELQEVDLELESTGQTLQQAVSQLGESQAVLKAREKLASERQRLDDLKHEQHSLEWEVDDITTKLTTLEEELYSGRIKNPKELANLQQETGMLKDKRNQLEDKALEIMEQVEMATAGVANLAGQLETLEAEWQSQQQKMEAEIERLRAVLTGLKQKRELISAEVDRQAVSFYDELRKKKGIAVAKVEQGVCHGCRISLSNAELQRVRSGSLMQCSSCGRILFLA
jgi:predicted  nucleic acid-binding Zn-ribbon protein